MRAAAQLTPYTATVFPKAKTVALPRADSGQKHPQPSTLNPQPSTTVASAFRTPHSAFDPLLIPHSSPLTSNILDWAPCAWDQLLAQFPNATPFHSSAWITAIAEAYNFKPLYLAIGPADAPIAILPLMEVKTLLRAPRAISLPFTDFCPLLVRDSEAFDFTSLFRPATPGSASSVHQPSTLNPQPPSPTSALRPLTSDLRSSAFRVPRSALEFCHLPSAICHSSATPHSSLLTPHSKASAFNWRSIELRGVEIDGAPASDQFLTHNLDLTVGEAALWKNCSSANCRNIAKARKSGVTVRKDNSIDALKTFYRLQCRTRRKHGLPPQPYKFFQSIHAHVLSKGAGTIYLAEQGTNVVAAALFLHGPGSLNPQPSTLNHTVIYKYGASDERYLDLRANNLLMWNAIADYAAAGFQNLNFGRTELSNEGLRRYKMAFGCSESSLAYLSFDYRMNKFVQARGGSPFLRVVQPLFRRLPLAVARAAGALIYRQAA